MTPDAFALFILTMSDDAARRAPLLAWLDARQIPYQLFFGVDGRAGLAQKWETSIDRPAAAEKLGRTMGDGEFACALSHQEIYRIVLEQGLPGAVILEDDACPTEAFAAFLADKSYSRADMILLDHSNTRVTTGGTLDLGGGIAGRPVALPPFLTTGYTISATAAAGLRAASLPISFTADWPCDISRFGALATWPRLIGHPMASPDQSHISGDRVQPQHRGRRFLRPDYWQRWWRKRRSVRLPDAEIGGEK
jgi:glycosyl transferase family 25